MNEKSDFRKFDQRVRYTHGLQIYYRDKHTITVSQGMTCVMFHRWYERHRGDFKRKWRPFAMALMRNNSLYDLYDIYRLANRYDIDSKVVTTTMNTIPPKGIRVLREVY